MTDVELVTPDLLRDWRLPAPSGSKKDRSVVVVGGAATSPGAVALAGLAALRVGAGHVQLAVAASTAPALAASFPEAGVIGLPEDGKGSVRGAASAELLEDKVSSVAAVLIGPGLDDIEETASLLGGLLPHLSPDAVLVLDAYALGALSRTPELADLLRARESSTVLTPNSQELGLLLDREVEGSVEEMLEVATSYHSCVTAQGTIAAPAGEAWRVPQGHAGLATAGSGDVLAGLVVGVLARSADAAQAACWATYLHSTAGERLSSAIGGVGFLARELIDQVPPVLSELT